MILISFINSFVHDCRPGDMAKMAKFRPGNGHRVEEFEGGGSAPAYTGHLWLVDYTTLIAEIRERLLIQS